MTHINGITSFALFFILFILFIIFRNKIRLFISKKYFWPIFATIWLVWLLGSRYIPFLYDTFTNKTEYASDLKWTNIFMTNLCPMAMIVLIIISYNSNWRKKIGPGIGALAIVGGFLNIVGYGIAKSDINVFEFLFLKQVIEYTNSQNIIERSDSWGAWHGHVILFFHALLIILEKGKLELFDLKVMVIYGISFLAYVGVIMGATGQKHNVTGLWISDWSQSQGKLPDGIFWPIMKLFWSKNTTGIFSILKTIVGLLMLTSISILNFFLMAYIFNNKNKWNRVKKFLIKKIPKFLVKNKYSI